MVRSVADGDRGKDGMLRRFAIEAMGEICALVPDFGTTSALAITRIDRETNEIATKFYKRFVGLKRFRDQIEHRNWKRDPAGIILPSQVEITRSAYRCTNHAAFAVGTLTLPASHANPMEVLHILAHYCQPETSPWHGGEFGAIFLDFVERQYDADMKRRVKDIMIEKRLKTFVKSDASRLKQSAAYYNKITAQVPQGLAEILADLRGANLLVDDREN